MSKKTLPKAIRPSDHTHGALSEGLNRPRNSSLSLPATEGLNPVLSAERARSSLTKRTTTIYLRRTFLSAFWPPGAKQLVDLRAIYRLTIAWEVRGRRLISKRL